MSGSLIPNAKQQFLDANGNPLAGGFVYYYIPGTTTFKNTYQNAALTILNTNPIILDSAGECIAYGVGSFRQIVTDVNGNLIWDQPTLSLLTNDATTVIYNPPFTNSVSETVSAKLSQTISVKDFGAKGDGVTDDTVAIQNAINYACDSVLASTAQFFYAGTGFTIYVPPGNYIISSTLQVYTGSVTLQGAGKLQTAIWLSTTNSSLNAINFTRLTAPSGKPSSNAGGYAGGLMDVSIGMLTAATGKDVLFINSWAQINISRVWIRNAGRYGMWIGNLVAGRIDDVFIDNSKLGGTYIGLGGSPLDHTTALVVDKLYVSSVTGDGSKSFGILIEDCLGGIFNGVIVEGVVGTDPLNCAGIRITDTVQTTFTGLYFEGNKGWDVDIGTTGASTGPNVNFFGVRATNNPGYQLSGCGSFKLRSNNGGGAWGYWSNDVTPAFDIDSNIVNFTIQTLGRGTLNNFVKYNGGTSLKNYNGIIGGSTSVGDMIQDGAFWTRLRNGGRLGSYSGAPTWYSELGDCIINNAPSTGSPAGWLCTDPVTPTYITIAGQATAQANSTAATVADLVTDFNALLTKLRASGALKP
jgi:hypothetical protein